MEISNKKRGRGPGTPVPRLKEERLLAGYTVRSLAEAAGVDPSTVNAVENGHRGVQGTTLTKLAETLDVESRDLVGDGLGTPDTRLQEREPVLVSGRKTSYRAMDLLDTWAREAPKYDRETLPELQSNLDEDRTHRKLFS